jgi:hypothetical protein
MKRTVLGFSVRADATISLAEMRKRIEGAFGCKLQEGNYHGIPMLRTELMGMQILFSEWRGLGGADTFQLHGFVDDPKFLEGSDDDVGVIEINIAPAIIDLLAVRAASEWRVPSQAEIEAEIEYGEEIRRDFLTTGDESDES